MDKILCFLESTNAIIVYIVITKNKKEKRGDYEGSFDFQTCIRVQQVLIEIKS
jgi:hypothetical protein